MKLFNSTEELLDFAIGEEESASLFYREMAEKVTRPAMSQLFQQFSDEENKHREKLESVKAGKIAHLPDREVLNLGLSEILVEEEPVAGMDYAQALVLAMKKESAAHLLYKELAGIATDPDVKELLLGLAHEEANHRLRFEAEYDQHVLTEN